MFIKRLYLQYFRNYDECLIDFKKNINVFIGDNAQGKTSLLEAIHYLSLTKSHRTYYDKEIIKFNQNYALIQAIINNEEENKQFSIQILNKGKKIKVDSFDYKKTSEYIGSFRTVIFSPEDLDLAKGSPQGRRRFIDMALSQVFPAYIFHLNKYNTLLKERNELLKSLKNKDSFKDFLNVIDDQLIELNFLIARKRAEFINKLNNFANTKHKKISADKENLVLDYIYNFDEIDKMSIKKAFDKCLDKDIYRGSTTIGIHRDDFKMSINDLDVSIYGSQGQQRTSVLSLKLSLIDFLYDETKKYPVLLLDDVLSELDDSRQSLLLDSIEDKIQTFITTTNILGIRKDIIRKADVFKIENSTLNRIEGDYNES